MAKTSEASATPVGHQEDSTGHLNGTGHQHDSTGYENGLGHQKFHGEDDCPPEPDVEPEPDCPPEEPEVCDAVNGSGKTPVGHQEDSTGHLNGTGHQHDSTGYENGLGHQKFHCAEDEVDDCPPEPDVEPEPDCPPEDPEVCDAVNGSGKTPVGHQEDSTGHLNGTGHQHDSTGYENGLGHQKFHCVEDEVDDLMDCLMSGPPLDETMPAGYEEPEDEMMMDMAF